MFAKDIETRVDEGSEEPKHDEDVFCNMWEREERITEVVLEAEDEIRQPTNNEDDNHDNEHDCCFPLVTILATVLHIAWDAVFLDITRLAKNLEKDAAVSDEHD